MPADNEPSVTCERSSLQADRVAAVNRTRSTEDLDDQSRAAADTAQSILNADPGLGPIDVVYVGRDEDVHDMRYLIVLFPGEKVFCLIVLRGQRRSSSWTTGV